MTKVAIEVVVYGMLQKKLCMELLQKDSSNLAEMFNTIRFTGFTVTHFRWLSFEFACIDQVPQELSMPQKNIGTPLLCHKVVGGGTFCRLFDIPNTTKYEAYCPLKINIKGLSQVITIVYNYVKGA